MMSMPNVHAKPVWLGFHLLWACVLMQSTACGQWPESMSGFILNVKFADDIDVWRLRITVIENGEVEQSGARFVPDAPRRLDPKGESMRLLFDQQENDRNMSIRLDGIAEDNNRILGSVRQQAQLVVGEMKTLDVTLIEPALCGDNVKHPNAEDCDDGNQEDGDGCSRICLYEP